MHFVPGERTVSRRPHRRKKDLVQESYERTGGFAVFHRHETATRPKNPEGLFEGAGADLWAQLVHGVEQVD
jgi:hypothetical protein